MQTQRSIHVQFIAVPAVFDAAFYFISQAQMRASLIGRSEALTSFVYVLPWLKAGNMVTVFQVSFSWRPG